MFQEYLEYPGTHYLPVFCCFKAEVNQNTVCYENIQLIFTFVLCYYCMQQTISMQCFPFASDAKLAVIFGISCMVWQVSVLVVARLFSKSIFSPNPKPILTLILNLTLI